METLLGGHVVVGLLVLLRVGAAALLLPGWSAAPVSGLARVGLPLAVALCFAAPVASGLAPGALPLGEPLRLVVISLREAAVGGLLGLGASLGLHAARAAGGLFDWALGRPERGGPLARLYLLLAIVVFFGVGGHRSALAALARSYEAIPLDGGARLASAAPTLPIDVTGQLIAAALGLAAPVVIAVVLGELALAGAGRLVPRMHLALLALPARALLATAAVLATLLVATPGLHRAIRAGLMWADRVAAGAGP